MSYAFEQSLAELRTTLESMRARPGHGPHSGVGIGQAADGKVKTAMAADGHLLGIVLDPSVLRMDERELARVIVTAVNEAWAARLGLDQSAAAVAAMDPATLHVMPYPVTPVDEEQKEMEERFASKIGFRRRISVTFRFRGTASIEERDVAWTIVLNAVIAFVRQYPAEAVLMFNGEEILMRWHHGEIIFDTSEYFEEIPGLAQIVSRHRQEPLDQPYL